MADILQWIYNSNTGLITQLPSPAATVFLSSGTGWHGPFTSRAEAEAYYERLKLENPGWKAPTKDFGTAVGNLGDSATERAVGAATGDYGAWFIRIGEIMLGLVLIGVGLAKLTGTTNLIAKAAKVAIP